MSFKLDTGTKEQISYEELTGVLTGARLIVHNDDYNTFEWVIESLIKICKHTFEQAEQCAMIVHFKGKYAVKEGTYEFLKPMKEALAERGLNVTIDS